MSRQAEQRIQQMDGESNYGDVASLDLQLKRFRALPQIEGCKIQLPQGRQVGTGVSRCLSRKSFLADHRVMRSGNSAFWVTPRHDDEREAGARFQPEFLPTNK